MDNLPNNEIKTENEEFSTIFSDPTQHSNTLKPKKNKRFIKVLSLLLTVAVIIGGTFAVIKLIPEKETEESSQNNKINVLDYESDDIKQVTVKNKNGSFNLYSKVVEAEDETTGEELSETFWYLKGYGENLTDSDTIKDVVDAAVDIQAIREITTKTLSECGLEKPSVTAEITDNKDKTFTLQVGSQSPDNAGVYVKTSDSDKIYLIGDMLNDILTFTDLDLASMDAQSPITLSSKYKSYLSNGTISKFDSLTLSGEKFNEKLVFKMNTEEGVSSFIPYEIISPVKRTADNVDGIVSVFSQGFPVSGAYSYDVKKTTLKELGFDNPDFEISAEFYDYTYTYKFKKQSDGDYAVVGTDSVNVKKVTSSDCAFLDYTTTDFYSSLVFITSIDGVSNLKLETADKTHDFSIALKEEGDSTNKYIVECNNKTYNSTYFQSFYQYLCGMEAMDYDVQKTDKKADLKITYIYNEKGIEPTVVEFYKVNATKYQYSVDGVAMGRIGSTSYNKIHKNLERLLAGKQVIVN